MKIKTMALSVAIATSALTLNQSARAESSPYRVSAGTKVDQDTLSGWRTWRALACERCHGAQQEGLVGPSLIDSMKQLSQEKFELTVLSGRPEKGMPGFASSDMLNKNIVGLYAYLKGRSDGAIQLGRLELLEK
jgi:mono/diheme cytochrome c family protein